ncbi:desulfoferrodoxin [Patescibacteria group bacterium]
MIAQKQIYKCSACGNIVEVLHAGEDTLTCCNKLMQLIKEKTQDEGLEKHVPVIEKTEKGILVKVGATPHPMEEMHYIEWIEIIVNGESCRKFLKPGDKPEAEFQIDADIDQVTAREYCNLHGLWKSN